MTRRALAIVVALTLAGCPSGSNVAQPALTTTSPDAQAGVSTKPGMAVPSLRVVLDDPRLALAKTLERAKEPALAAKAMRDARPADLPKSLACGWDYVEGRLWLAAGSGNGPRTNGGNGGDAGAPDALANAAAAFVKAEDPACPLAPYAKLREAQLLARAGRSEEAIARARAVPDEIALSDEAKLVLAESLSARGDRAGALPLWRAWLAANAHGPRWVDTSVRIAIALLDGIDGPPESKAREAYDLATRVITEAPRFADSSGASTARARAAALLKGKQAGVSESLGDDERGRQAQAWLDAGETQKAFDLASSVLGDKKGRGPTSCKVAMTRANAAQKIKGSKGDAWADAVTVCEKESDLVTVLYTGAKSRAGKDPKLAIEWYGKLEQLFPAHRLADDARFRGALLVAQSADEGHEGRAEQMLRTLPDAYPAGDMRTEALFRVALAKMQHGDWEAAKALLDRIDEIAPNDRHWASAGRAEYFRARAAAMTGDAEGARKRWQHIVETHPLAFYMLLAYSRLAAEDPAAAKKTLDAAVARDKGGAFPSRPHAELDSAGAQRAMRLLEVGEVEAARREFSNSGATAEGVDNEVVWTVGALYNQAGVPEIGHSFSRARLADHLEHYPEGKWRFAWEVAYPRAFEPLVVKTCEKYALPRELAWGIMREESSFVPDAKSPSNAYGLMQLIVPTAKWMAAGTPYAFDEGSLKKPDTSVELGTKLLAHLRTAHGHPGLAIGAYNGGSGAINRWVSARSSDDFDLFVEAVPWDETRNYIKRVLASEAAYAYLYDPPGLTELFGLPLKVVR